MMPLDDAIAQPEQTSEATGAPRSIASFSNSYARLPERFFARLAPTHVARPRLLAFNHPLAAQLGLDVAGFDSPSLAAAYAGHQFGNFVRQLGDGRAILLGELMDRDGKRRDIQLKGAGPTPFS